jgi:RNA polymerase sigma-70 factor (ECF subfamily)
MSVRGVSSEPEAVSALARVGRLPPGQPDTSAAYAGMDQASVIWLERLSAVGADREAAVGELHAMLLRAARFEVRRRQATSAHVAAGDQDDLAQQSADDALVAILGKLGDFRGDSRFTTWAHKFALYQAAAKMRKKAWQGREISLEAETRPLIADQRQRTPQQGAETAELITVITRAIESELSPHHSRPLARAADGPSRPRAELRGVFRSARPLRRTRVRGLRGRGADTGDAGTPPRMLGVRRGPRESAGPADQRNRPRRVSDPAPVTPRPSPRLFTDSSAMIPARARNS